MKNSAIYGIFAGLVAASIWGGMYVVSKAVMAVIPPYLLLTSRLLLGILTLYLVITLRGGLRVTRKQFWQIFGIGFVGYGSQLDCNLWVRIYQPPLTALS